MCPKSERLEIMHKPRYPCPDNNQDYHDGVQSFPHLRLYAVCETMIDSGDLTVAYEAIRGLQIYSRFKFIIVYPLLNEYNTVIVLFC